MLFSRDDKKSKDAHIKHKEVSNPDSKDVIEQADIMEHVEEYVNEK